ncbi:PQQ-binding-like beta-propeller repeat protein [Streptomyces sp. NPDC048172]|uniref:outer membrane protein assembly factor BamB family protein n=1 Tax=Streptomyces sp. NPDC048172 TaxID=3365505 RepID=UPI00372192A7
MRPPQGEIPRQLDRYRIVATLDTASAADGPRWFLGQDDRTGRVDVVRAVLPGEVADDAGYRLRFRAEAGKSTRLKGPWTAPVTHVAPRESPLPWVAYGVGPALPLPAALDAHGGPLPEETVRALGAALAETLLWAHRDGLVHAGLSPESVLLTPSGPALTGFGLVRAASPEGTPRHSVPGVAPESLPPEQRTGGTPQPLGDIYALATVLAYAATGQRAPAPRQLPERLRPLLTSGLAPDPASRPRADAFLQQLAPPGGARPGTPEPPASVLRALEEQAARHPGGDAGVPAAPALAPALAPAPTGPPQDGGTGAETAAPRRSPSRRALLTGATYGALGLGLGAAAVGGWRATRADPVRPRDPLAVSGVAPVPLWRREIETDGVGDTEPPVLAGPRRALFATDGGVLAFDLATGKQQWSRDDMSARSLHYAGDDTAVLADMDVFSLISTRSGRVKWQEKRYEDGALGFEAVIAVQDGTLFFMGRREEKKAGQSEYAVVAYRLRDRKERWRKDIHPAYGATSTLGGFDAPPVVRKGELLLPNANTLGNSDEKYHGYLALSMRTGRERWRRSYPGIEVEPSGLCMAAPGGLLVLGPTEGRVQARDLRSGAKRWTRSVHGIVDAKAVHGNGALYLVDEKHYVYAVAARDGRRRWRARLPLPPGTVPHEGGMEISASGKTLLLSGNAEILALDTAGGRPLWRLAAVQKGEGGAPRDEDGIGARPGVVVAKAPGLILVATESSLYALPVD